MKNNWNWNLKVNYENLMIWLRKFCEYLPWSPQFDLLIFRVFPRVVLLKNSKASFAKCTAEWSIKGQRKILQARVIVYLQTVNLLLLRGKWLLFIIIFISSLMVLKQQDQPKPSCRHICRSFALATLSKNDRNFFFKVM